MKIKNSPFGTTKYVYHKNLEAWTDIRDDARTWRIVRDYMVVAIVTMRIERSTINSWKNKSGKKVLWKTYATITVRVPAKGEYTIREEYCINGGEMMAIKSILNWIAGSDEWLENQACFDMEIAARKSGKTSDEIYWAACKYDRTSSYSYTVKRMMGVYEIVSQ